MAAVAVGSAGMQYEYSRQQKYMAEDATQRGREATAANVANIKAEGAEQKRRQLAENQRLESIATVKAGKSGLKIGVGGSIDTFLSSIKDIGVKELDWLTKATKSQADLASVGGQYQSIADMAKARSAGSAMTGSLVSGVSSLGSWWDKYGAQVKSDFAF